MLVSSTNKRSYSPFGLPMKIVSIWNGSSPWIDISLFAYIPLKRAAAGISISSLRLASVNEMKLSGDGPVCDEAAVDSLAGVTYHTRFSVA